MASQELVPSQEPAMPAMPAGGPSTRGRAQTKKTRLVEHTTQEEDTPEGDHMEIHQVRQIQEVVKKVAVVHPGPGRSRRGGQLQQEEGAQAGVAGEDGAAPPSRRATRRMDEELNRAMERDLEPMAAKPATARRTWKKVVVEGGTAPEPAGAEEEGEGEEEEEEETQRAAVPQGRGRGRRGGRSQPSYHHESLETEIPPTQALEPELPGGVLEAAMEEIEAPAEGEGAQGAEEFATPQDQLAALEATPEDLAPPVRASQRLRPSSGPGLASQQEQEEHLMGPPSGIAQARRRAAAVAAEAADADAAPAEQEAPEEEQAGPSRTPAARKRKAPGTQPAGGSAPAATVGPAAAGSPGGSRGARRGRLFGSEEQQEVQPAVAAAPVEDDAEEEEEQPAASRGVLGAAEAVGKAIRSVLGGRTQEEHAAPAPTTARKAPTRPTAGRKVPASQAPPAGAAAKKGGKKGGRGKKRGGAGGGEETYKRYIHRVLKQVHPELNISTRAMGVMQSFMQDAFDRVTAEAARLTRYSKRATLSAREVQTAVRLVLPGELARHAVVEGKKAVARISGL